MKKLIIVLVLLLAATALFGQINLGSFPAGKWLDPNYDAVWELSATNIRILSSTDGSVLWDFTGKTIQDFKGVLDGGVPAITFSCTEAERTYKFKPNPPSTDVTLTIDRADKPTYSIRMKKQ